ncbi:MAG TPA: hypothetical protein VHY76_10355 [Acetobacteraceae bacterium]|jgi:hypothetical protein|nr:hypothetical protein [Acetobacteraceae bacterium]
MTMPPLASLQPSAASTGGATATHGSTKHHGHQLFSVSQARTQGQGAPAAALQGTGFTPGAKSVVPGAGSTTSDAGLLSSDLARALQAYQG